MAAALACSFSLHPLPSSRRRRSRTLPPPATKAATASQSPPPKALTEIRSSGVIACLRAKDSMLAMEAARAALSAGITVLEVVMATPGVLEVIQGLMQDFPSLTIGVGTVLNAEDARKAVNVGAKFLMSPGTVMEILLQVHRSEVLYIPGVMTPTEVLSAYSAGAKVVKVYPVSILGGDKYISALKKPFPLITMIASQGITLDSVKRYIEGGASAVVLSDAIFDKEAMSQGNFNEIHRLARIATLQGGRAVKMMSSTVGDLEF